MKKIFETNSPEETLKFGIKLGQSLKPGDVVAMDGDLGAGKTLMTRGICEGMGLDPEWVQSPTFTIVNEYVAEGKTPLFHFDTYRLSGEEDFLASGLDEYFYRDGVVVIEWAALIEPLLPEGTLRINISGTGDQRTIDLEFPEGRFDI